jgi:hypothetical protein
MTRQLMERILIEVHGKDKVRTNKIAMKGMESLFSPTSYSPSTTSASGGSSGAGKRSHHHHQQQQQHGQHGQQSSSSSSLHYPQQEIAVNLKDFEFWYNSAPGTHPISSGSGGTHHHKNTHSNSNMLPSQQPPVAVTLQARFVDYLDHWIRSIFYIFFEPLPHRVQILHRRYAIQIEAEEVIDQYGITREAYEKLREMFINRYSDPYKYHITSQQWQVWLSPFYVQECLAAFLFESRLDHFLKIHWKFVDFADFTLSYASPMMELRCQAIVTAFLKVAIRLNDYLEHSLEEQTQGQQADGEREGKGEGEKAESGIRCLNSGFEVFLAEYLTYMVYLLALPVDYSPAHDKHGVEGVEGEREGEGEGDRERELEEMDIEDLLDR